MTDETAAPEAASDAVAPEAPAERSPDARSAVSKALSGMDWGDDTPEADEALAAISEPPAAERDERGRFKAKEAGAEAEAADDQEAAEKPEAKPEKEDKPRPRFDPPAGLSAEGKAAWEQTPDPVKADISRRLREMETGLQGYQSEFGALKQYAEMARKEGTTLADVVQNYVSLENLLRQDARAGIEAVAKAVGFDLSQLGQPAGEVDSRDQTIAELRRDLAELKQGWQGFQQSQQQREQEAQQRTIQQQVEAFAADHPRLDELDETMAGLIRAGIAADIETAYQMAERINPAPQPEIPAPAAAQTRALPTSRSIAGAPASGSNPAARKPPADARTAVSAALRTVGL